MHLGQRISGEAKAPGQSYHTVVRSLAFKWLRILWRMWHDGVPYDESIFTTA
jgi:hypothetical protein